MKKETLKIIQVRFLSSRNKIILKKIVLKDQDSDGLTLFIFFMGCKKNVNNFHRVLKEKDFESKFLNKILYKGK